jgi:chemotaxis protein methyltransferase CheR
VGEAALGEAQLSRAELAQIVRLVYERSGITLHDGKRALIMARLQKRLHAGGFSSFSAYLRHVERDTTGAELTTLLDAIATNHTSFFREPQHFDLLRSRILPELLGRSEPVRIWSAACSTGEEPTTLAITLAEALPAHEFARARILASDLSTRALATAKAGVYSLERVSEIPPVLLRKYFERGMGAQDGLVRVAAALRSRIDYRQVNLMDTSSVWESFDVIFCRNVMIYFDRAVQERVVAQLERRLAPGGYLFIAHSESLNGVAHSLRWVAPAMYRKVSS